MRGCGEEEREAKTDPSNSYFVSGIT